MRVMRAFLFVFLFGSPSFLLAQEKGVDAATFLRAHCFKCHGDTKKSGGVRLDDLPADPGKDVERWLAVRDQVRDHLMPPAKESRPKDEDLRAFVSWVTVKTGARPARLPNQGNLIPHELLFGAPIDKQDEDASPSRLWRLSPDAYVGLLHELLKGRVGNKGAKGQMPAGIIQPFNLVDERGIRDFSGLYSIDEPTTEVLLRNSAAIVDLQVGAASKQKTAGVSELAAAYRAETPLRKHLDAAVQTQYRLAIGRKATSEELERYWSLYEKCAKGGDRAGAVKTVLQAVLLKSDAIFRSEMAKSDGKGRQLLAPLELARAISLVLGERRDPHLWQAAETGKLSTKEEISAHVKRLLDEEDFSKTRIMKFFHEYFEYHRADDVFKDRPKDFLHEPKTLIKDTDQLVAHILATDKDVFRQLLTTELSFVSHAVKLNKQKQFETGPAHVLNNNNKGRKLVEHVYGYDKWPSPQPVTLPKDTRIGILMQPSWLVAWGTNFDNDPVRRGRWIRERLLGGTVPDLPIGVAAQIPDDPHRTLRDRLKVTRETQCWKCHQRMDDLGFPFEQFDHFGRFRTGEDVLDEAKPLAKGKGKAAPAPKSVPLDTTGLVADSGDARLDGVVKDPREMIRKIADSDRARQVFIRHVFRYLMGRNEMLSDARTLQEADRAYVQSGGSFKALVHSLLTSDVFLFRRTGAVASR